MFVAITTPVIGANARPVASADRPWSRWKNRLRIATLTTLTSS